MAHTPKPWRWTKVDYLTITTWKENKDGGDFDALWSDAAGKAVMVAQDASSYAATCDFANEADAPLIAAAPDLLEALKELSAAFHSMGPRGDELLFNAHQAIAKAEGE